MTAPPLIAGHDRDTGLPIVVARFAVRYDVHGKLSNTYATCAGRALQARFLAGLLESAEDQQAEKFATRVAAKLGTRSAMEPERFDVEQAAAVASVTPKALRHRVQRGLVPERLIIREGRRLFFAADGWRKFVVSNKSRTGR
jgi:hypothetical protein